MSEEFSLERFERFAYGRHHEAATLELLRLLEALQAGQGAYGDVGGQRSDDPEARRRDDRVAARLASAAAALFADPDYGVSEAGFARFAPLHRWLATIFGASSARNADHVIWSFAANAEGGGAPVSLHERDLAKFCLLYSLDSAIPLDFAALWSQDRRAAAALFLGMLSSRIVASAEAQARKEGLLAWLPARLEEVSFDEVPATILHDVWMHCSYADGAGKHEIKRAINRVLRRKLLSLGLGDLPPPRPRPQDKPVLACVLERFFSGHSIYRTHSLSMEALRTRYRLVGISLQAASDAAGRALFDEMHVLPPSQDVFRTVDQVRAIVAASGAEVLYYPSVGMLLEAVCLVNLRLAPLQLVAMGHPATTHSPFVDYVLVEEDYLGEASCFSETIAAVPKDAIPYRPPANCPSIPVRRGATGERVRVAIPASAMKVNRNFLDVLRAIAERSPSPVEFHFLTSFALGLARVHLQNRIREALGRAALVYPFQPYEAYLRNINECDMFLSPFPFGNTNGIVDTVRQALPGVCLTGPEVHTRIDSALFARLGLPQWLVGRTAQEYEKAALRLIGNAAERNALRRHLEMGDPDATLFRGRPEAFAEAVARLQQARAT